MRRAAASLVMLAFAVPAVAGQTRVLNSFESQGDLRRWDINTGSPRRVTEHATHGKTALEITFDPKGRYGAAYMATFRRQDWSAFDAFRLDVFNPNDRPVRGYLLVADRAWQQKGSSYWNRHNQSVTLAPGRTTWTIPVRGLYRGEAGSRNNDIKRNIDPDQIVRVDFGFGKTGETGRIILDHLRLVKGGRPDGVWAFDFGPPDQSAMLGWTPLSQRTRFDRKTGYGWGPRGGAPWDGAARDTTFGPALIRDFCEAGGYRFSVAVPPGRYRVMVIYENSGYWGGEQAKHSWRTISADGKELWREERPDGPAHALYRFEDTEPVGVDIWDTYMAAELAKPIVFEAKADRDDLTLRFKADVPWGSKLACLALHQAGDETAEKWLADQLDAVEAEFRSKAVCLDKPAPEPPDLPQLAVWPVRVEDDVTPGTVPPPDAPLAKPALSAVAVRGETQVLSLAVRPKARSGRCQVGFTWHDAASPLPADIHVVHYNTGRGFGQIAYHIRPHTLRKSASVDLPAGVTRQSALKRHVPVSAPADTYEGRLLLKHNLGGGLLIAPVRLTVKPVTLNRATDFRFGFFGLMPPGLIPKEKRWNVLEDTLKMLREYGMNQLCGGPSWALKGWRDGQPIIDYGEMDRFFALCREHGFTGPHNGYGGLRFRGLHDRYWKGRTGEKAERESGVPYQQTLLRAWGAIAEHAREHNWPLIKYAMCDETRVREVAERELAFMKMMATVSDAYPDTLRTSGSYSVHFNKRPTDKNDLLYWHQRFFEALDISDLNLHDGSVMAEAEKLGKTIHIYNQGRTRYSFGMYQWSEYRKGVKARTQWHLNILHGYQFFDLDGREPDTAMICYGREGIYPTIRFERCREGAEDFYLYNTLWKLIEKRRAAGRKSQALDDAVRLLEGTTKRIKLNQRTKPDWFGPDAFKLRVIAAIETLQEK